MKSYLLVATLTVSFNSYADAPFSLDCSGENSLSSVKIIGSGTAMSGGNAQFDWTSIAVKKAGMNNSIDYAASNLGRPLSSLAIAADQESLVLQTVNMDRDGKASSEVTVTVTLLSKDIKGLFLVPNQLIGKTVPAVLTIGAFAGQPPADFLFPHTVVGNCKVSK